MAIIAATRITARKILVPANAAGKAERYRTKRASKIWLPVLPRRNRSLSSKVVEPFGSGGEVMRYHKRKILFVCRCSIRYEGNSLVSSEIVDAFFIVYLSKKANDQKQHSFYD